MSWIDWTPTSNSLSILLEPFRSRCPPLQLRHLTPDEPIAFLRREGVKRGLSEPRIEAIAEVLTHPFPHRPSLRIANRTLQRAADLECGPLLY